MVELVLKSSRFRAEREADWARLERLLAKVEKGSAAALSDEELIALPVLYRATLSSLSVARATSLDRSLVDYLESLSTRAYFVVYGTRASAWERISQFFARDWPAAAQAIWRETLVSAALMVAGAVIAFMLTAKDPEWYEAFVPGALAEGRTPGAATAALRATLFDSHHGRGLSLLASFLFTHNAGIAFLAFALGFAFCLPTAALELVNGCTLGAFLSVFIGHGLGYEAGGWLMIHGVTELFATVLAGAAGFRIGCAVAFPGGRTRLDAAAEEGRRAAVLMVGVVVMLFCAGLLEGFARQLIQDTVSRYAIAAATGVIWLSYLYLPRAGAASPAAGERAAAPGDAG
jgi:uncharacterized membrane protein SpoIIM required for sporulation